MTSIERSCVVSFDFDDTLAEYVSTGWYDNRTLVCIPQFMDLLRGYHALGCRCIILTARSPEDKHVEEIEAFLKQHGIEDAVADIVFTAHQPKGPFAEILEVKLHYDDSAKHLDSVKSHGIQVVASKATLSV